MLVRIPLVVAVLALTAGGCIDPPGLPDVPERCDLSHPCVVLNHALCACCPGGASSEQACKEAVSRRCTNENFVLTSEASCTDALQQESGALCAELEDEPHALGLLCEEISPGESEPAPELPAEPQGEADIASGEADG